MILKKSIKKQRDELRKLLTELQSYTVACTDLMKRVDDAHRNGKVLLLEDLTENVVNQLIALARDDKTIVLFSKDGHRIEIKEKQEEVKKRKNLF